MTLGRYSMYPILRHLLTFVLSLFTIIYSISSSANVLSTTPAKLVTQFNYLGKEQGVEPNSVSYLVEDGLGFIWMGTTSGVYRYDGQESVLYNFENSGLSKGFVTSMLIDSQGVLWVGTESGLNKFDAKLERFVSLKHKEIKNEYVWSIFEDSLKQIWVGTSNGLFILEGLKIEPVKLKLSGKDIPLKEVKTFFQDSNGLIWISTDRGDNFVVDPMLAKLYLLTEENLLGIRLDSIRINKLIQIDENTLLIVRNSDILKYSNNQISSFYKVSENGERIFDALKIDEKYIWISSNSGLFKLAINSDSATMVESIETGHKFLGGLFDSNKNIWFGSVQKGLIRHVKESELFSSLSTLGDNLGDDIVWSLAQEGNHSVWIAGNSRILSRYNLDENTITKVDSTISGIKSLVATNGELYIGSNEGLFRLVQNDGDANSELLVNFEVTYLAADKDYIYASSWGRGLYRINKKSALAEEMSTGNNTLPYITTLRYYDKHLYVGTLDSAYVFDLETGMSKQISELSGKRISFISVNDSDVYVSTASSGVYHFSNQLSELIEHIANPKLNKRAIYSVLKDNTNSLWMSTDQGILKLSEDGVVYQFDIGDGLVGDDFNDNSALKSKKGILFFGGTKGLNFIDPRKLKRAETHTQNLVFTNLTVFNNPVVINQAIEGNVKLKESIISADEVVLEYSDYPFELTYNLVNYPQPNKVKYRYKLIDIDNAWLKGKTNRTATYTNLEFGTYRFEVEAFHINTNEVLARNSLKVIVLPPLWLSPLAISLYLFLLVAIVAAVLHVINQRKKSAIEIKNAAKRLELSLWGSGDLMWDWDLVKDHVYHSKHWQQFDYQGLNQPELTQVHPKDRAMVSQHLQAHLSGDSEFFEASYRIKRHGCNDWIWIVDRAKVVSRAQNGSPLRMAGTIRDITQLKNAEERLNLQANVMSNISDAIYVMDLEFQVVDVNKAFNQITGLLTEQVLHTKRIFSTYHGGVAQLIQNRLKSGLDWVGEIKAKKPNGEYYFIELHVNPMLNNDNEISHYVAAFSDITQRKNTEQELRNLSNIDPLTKLPNRSYFQYAHRNLIRRKEPHALLTMDVDNFKKINDSMGHDEGDKLLCMIAERIDNRIDCQHLLCRLGGDEFALLLEDINDISMITQVLYDIEGAMQAPMELNGETLVMSCSIGVAIYPNDGETTENMLQSADTAMYHAKSEPGFSYRFFNSSMNESAVRRLQIEGLIRQALKNDWFEVYYQPKIDIKTESLMGMEALVRLVHPEQGTINPSEFIPIAEDTGLVIAIGEKVLDKACYATQQWRKNGLFNGRVAVNLAAKQFSQSDLLQRIDHILECTQLPLANLELEITEGTVIEDPEQAIATMQKLVDKGIHLALDDFGTGYSSLSYLKRFPIHTLKIDKAFIDDLSSEKNERHMVASIISIAHNMGVSVVAEGVEEQSQLQALRQLNCETIQGYYYSRPLSEQDFTSYLLKQQIEKDYSNLK